MDVQLKASWSKPLGVPKNLDGFNQSVAPYMTKILDINLHSVLPSLSFWREPLESWFQLLKNLIEPPVSVQASFWILLGFSFK
jgi:hypothetical protein